MEIALGGRPDDSAKMVCCRGCIAYLPREPLKRQRNYDLRGYVLRVEGAAATVPQMLQDSRGISGRLCCRNQLKLPDQSGIQQ
jgi:hypothetical protein